MPLFFATSLNSFSDRFSTLILLNNFFINMCLLLALSCVKFDDIVRDKCSLKYILFVAKHIYVSFNYTIKYLHICHTLIILHLNSTLNILLMTLFRSTRINKKTSKMAFFTFNHLTELP